MAVPTTRDEFKEYCLRKLGKPVIEINVDEDQVDDRVDEALRYYWDYHFDGTDKLYYKHKVTEQNKADKYITLPENIIGAVRVFPIADPIVRSDDLFNIRYQIALNDLYTLTSVSMVPYYMVMEHLALISEMLVGQQPIRFNRHKNRVYIDMDWGSINVNEFLLIEAYEVVDPDVWSQIWSDRWLQNYTTAKIKYQWGSNLTKFSGMNLPGGIQFNGEKILNDAQDEIQKMEQEMISSYSLPVSDMIG
ncbi:hypothetical protein UFOVP447_51 [uncultured Caudovirales phage]|uniref:Neck protein n=1 Tax=uncultured Caudovirales phage TaxID=2100421 RepID=A0A6J5MCZ7_9CAUD|nr:hypothetical protein UFOVP447_51 [uncultured Caudovirales phage]